MTFGRTHRLSSVFTRKVLTAFLPKGTKSGPPSALDVGPALLKELGRQVKFVPFDSNSAVPAPFVRVCATFQNFVGAVFPPSSTMKRTREQDNTFPTVLPTGQPQDGVLNQQVTTTDGRGNGGPRRKLDPANQVLAAGPSTGVAEQPGAVPSPARAVLSGTSAATSSSAARPPGTQDVDVGEEIATRMKMLAEKHKNDLYRCTRAKVVKAGLPNPRNADAVGFQLLGEDGKHFHVTLLDSWAEEWKNAKWTLEKGDIVHLIGDPPMYKLIEKHKHCEISDRAEHQYRMLCFHPDILLTGTAVSNALSCRRYALIAYEIGENMASTSAGSRALVVGNIVHAALQYAMACQDFTDVFIDNTLREEIDKNLVDLWRLKISTDEMFKDCRQRLRNATDWAQQYYLPLDSVKVVAKAGGRDKPKIAHLIGNEQNVCSHRFGLKGKLDGLVKTDSNKTSALEIKTGKIKTEHVGQITVYYLLLCDLVNQQLEKELQACSDEGLLLYPHKDQFTYDAKKISRFDIRAIMQIRNMLASTQQRRRQTLEEGKLRGPIWPPMIDRENGEEPSECRRCFRQSHCYTLAASCEQKKELKPDMDPRVAKYIQNWLMVIDAEEVLSAKAKERSWRTNTSLGRDNNGGKNNIKGSAAQDDVIKKLQFGKPDSGTSTASNGATTSSSSSKNQEHIPPAGTNKDDDRGCGLRYLQFETARLVDAHSSDHFFQDNAAMANQEQICHWVFTVPESEAEAKLKALQPSSVGTTATAEEGAGLQNSISGRGHLQHAAGTTSSFPIASPGPPRGSQIDLEDYGIAADGTTTTKKANLKPPDENTKKLVEDLLTLPFTVGEQVTISREPEGPYALFSAEVVEMDLKTRRIVVKPRMEIAAQLKTKTGAQMCATQLADIEDLQKAPSQMTNKEVENAPNLKVSADAAMEIEKIGNTALSGNDFYRMDKDEYGGGFQKIRGDLMQLVCVSELDNPFVGKIKRKLIFLEPPEFSDQEIDVDAQRMVVPGQQVPVSYRAKLLPTDIAPHKGCLEQWNRMNDTQKAVVEKCFKAEDYCVVQGYPGTGKTEVLANLLELYLRSGKRVLFCAYTNAAVDNGLLRLLRNQENNNQKEPLSILRLGAETKVHTLIKPYLLKNRDHLTTTAHVDHLVGNIQLVACTLLGCHDALVQHLDFDLVVVDEASQATEPATWCALFKTKKFVLFGDTNQLQPLVKHPKAKQFGLQVSLMERLAKLHPVCVAELTYQYRMNEDIQKLPNKLIYDGKLKCGNAQVSTRSMREFYTNEQIQDLATNVIANEEKNPRLFSLFKEIKLWERKALNPDTGVTFLDTGDTFAEDPVSKQENFGEANLCRSLVEKLVALNVPGRDIGVLSPYRRQLALVKEVFQNAHLTEEGVEVLTVDEAQGKDKKCILVSLVKSNTDRSVGQLLTDWRRMNVLLTRAQCKLILIGSVPTLKCEPLMEKMINECHGHDWICQVDS
ncbi:unnamed protein product [Amoebophrya sp. A120]|nr:unnamed protein product [Amoebophrya sp. A120]|eukprot:GSA120T00007919001.1